MYLRIHCAHYPTLYGRAVVQAVSRRPPTTEASVRARGAPCGICGGQCGIRTGFSLSFSVFPCQYNSTVVLHTHISAGGWKTNPFLAAVQRQSHPIEMKKKKQQQQQQQGILR
jgi:hypothetical protein